MEKSNSKTEFLRINDEAIIKELFKKYVTSNRFDQFCLANANSIKAISEGKVSDIVILNNNQTKQEYKARITGIQKVTFDNGKFYYKFHCYNERERLNIAPLLTINKATCELTTEQIETLKTNGRIDETLKFSDGTERYVAVDQELKQLIFVNKNSFKVPENLLDVPLTQSQKEMLEAGKKVQFLSLSPKDKNKMITRVIYFDPVKFTIKFEFPDKTENKPSVDQTISNALAKSQTNSIEIGKSNVVKDIENKISNSLKNEMNPQEPKIKR